MSEPTEEQLTHALLAAHAKGDTHGAQVLAGMIKQMRGQSSATPKKTVADRYQAKSQNMMGAVGSSLSHGLTAGADNVVASAISAPLMYGIDSLRGRSPTLAGEFHRAQGYAHAQDVADSSAHPAATAAAEFAGAVASPLNKVGAGIEGASLAARAARFAAPALAYGAVSGGTSAHGNALQHLQGAAEGAGASLAGGALGHGLGKLVQGAGRVAGGKLAPRFSPAVQALISKGVTLTPGQMVGGAAKSAEDKLMSQPVVGAMIKDARARGLNEWNISIYNRVLEPLGVKYEGNIVGHEGIEKVGNALSGAYDRLLPKLKFQNDGKFVTDVMGVLKEAKELPPDIQSQLQNIIGNRIAPAFGDNGVMDGRTFKALESEIGGIARKYRGSSVTSEREMAARLGDLTNAMKGALERSNPVYAPALKKLNQSWAAFTRVQNAAARRPTGDGLFTPSDLLNAAKTMDKSLRKGAFARGGALMQREARQAQSVLPSTVPNSGTTDRVALLELLKHPLKGGAMGLIGSAPYSRPGMKLINAAANSTPGKARNALAKLLQRGGNIAPAAGVYAGAKLANGGGQ